MEQETRGIIFKGNSEGLVIVIPDDYSFEQALSEIDAKVSNAARFFKGAKIKVTYRGIALDYSEEERIKEVLDNKSGAHIESFSKEDESRQNTFIAKLVQHHSIPATRAFSEDEGLVKFVRSTIRSGTRIQYDGNVVVMGDINPGGEVVASGNVIVLGTLRGMVHAGAEGDRKAIIYALNLKPTQIRIADAIARMPEEQDDGRICPEIAKIKDDIIEVIQL